MGKEGQTHRAWGWVAGGPGSSPGSSSDSRRRFRAPPVCGPTCAAESPWLSTSSGLFARGCAAAVCAGMLSPLSCGADIGIRSAGSDAAGIGSPGGERGGERGCITVANGDSLANCTLIAGWSMASVCCAPAWPIVRVGGMYVIEPGSAAALLPSVSEHAGGAGSGAAEEVAGGFHLLTARAHSMPLRMTRSSTACLGSSWSCASSSFALSTPPTSAARRLSAPSLSCASWTRSRSHSVIRLRTASLGSSWSWASATSSGSIPIATAFELSPPSLSSWSSASSAMLSTKPQTLRCRSRSWLSLAEPPTPVSRARGRRRDHRWKRRSSPLRTHFRTYASGTWTAVTTNVGAPRSRS